MTNEELAAQAKAGDLSALGTLWEQNRGLLARMLRRLTANPGSRERMIKAGVTFDDLMQESYFAVEKAARAYDPAREAKFSTYLAYWVTNTFFAAIGLRTRRDRENPLSRAHSLDQPLSDDEPGGITFGDTVPDEAAAQPFEDAEEKLWIQQLHAALDECLDTIPEKEAYAIRARYYHGQTQGQTAAVLGVSGSRVQQIERHGLRNLRSPGNRHRLEQYREEIISRYASRHTSFSTWEHYGSAQERAVEELERRELLRIEKEIDAELERLNLLLLEREPAEKRTKAGENGQKGGAEYH